MHGLLPFSDSLNMRFATAMGVAGERPVQVLINVALVALGVTAWSVLPANHASLMPLVCRSDQLSEGSLWEALGVYWEVGDVTGALASWLVMTLAMAPLLMHRALRIVTTVAAIPMLIVISATMEWIGLDHGLSSTWLAGASAIVWQLGPLKRRALNLCHRQPIRTTEGAMGTMTSARFGALSAVGCAGSCWALMLTAMALPGDMRLSMLAVLIAVAVERHLHRPCPKCPTPDRAASTAM
jgi:hypothetical protein